MEKLNNQLPAITDLARSLSDARIRQFLRQAGHDPVRAQQLHDWNENIGAALFKPLQKIELALRVRINQAFTAAYGPDWFRAEAFLDRANYADRTSVAGAMQRLLRSGKPIDADAMLANSSFGLCVGLLRPLYNPDVWSQQLFPSFPQLPKHLGRHELAERASQAAQLRNRIDHHEPLIERDLSLDHQKLLELLGWIDHRLAAHAQRDRSVPQLLRAKP